MKAMLFAGLTGHLSIALSNPGGVLLRAHAQIGFARRATQLIAERTTCGDDARWRVTP